MTGKEFAERIDFILSKRNQSRKAITADLGISSSTMSSWAAGRGSIPNANVVAQIADYLGVSTDWLITGKESESPDISGNTGGIDFVDRIEKLLVQKNLKRTVFAKSVGVTNQAFTDWRRRGTIPAADIACRIADSLHVDLRWLITGEQANAANIAHINLPPPEIIELAKDIDRLPAEFQNIIRQNVEEYKKLCFKLKRESTLGTG